jgi:hypothetical protein
MEIRRRLETEMKIPKRILWDLLFIAKVLVISLKSIPS